MKRNLIIFIMFSAVFSGFAFAERYEPIDFYVLIDTSLSMADAMPEAREQVAAELIGRIAVPGDWLCVIGFYGAQDILWEGELRDEASLATLVRSLRALTATGRFTDIGAALDFLEAKLRARGLPERPKYMLMITDERQEAPFGTRYYSADYSIEHPMLEFVKKEDHGPYRVITIGYGLSDRIRGASELLMRTLSEAPSRPSPPLPGAQPGDAERAAGAESGTGAAGMNAGAAGTAGSELKPEASAQADDVAGSGAGAAGTEAAGSEAGQGSASGSAAERKGSTGNSSNLLLIAAALAAFAVLALVAVRRGNLKRAEKPKDAGRYDHS